MSEETPNEPEEEPGMTEAEHEAATPAEPPEQDTPAEGEPEHPEEIPDTGETDEPDA